jgi:hypothetical protein
MFNQKTTPIEEKIRACEADREATIARRPTHNDYKVIGKVEIEVDGKPFKVYEIASTERYYFIARNEDGHWMTGAIACQAVEIAYGGMFDEDVTYSMDVYGFVTVSK